MTGLGSAKLLVGAVWKTMTLGSAYRTRVHLLPGSSLLVWRLRLYIFSSRFAMQLFVITHLPVSIQHGGPAALGDSLLLCCPQDRKCISCRC